MSIMPVPCTSMIFSTPSKSHSCADGKNGNGESDGDVMRIVRGEGGRVRVRGLIFHDLVMIFSTPSKSHSCADGNNGNDSDDSGRGLIG